jgi:hypothetical protein
MHQWRAALVFSHDCWEGKAQGDDFSGSGIGRERGAAFRALGLRPRFFLIS